MAEPGWILHSFEIGVFEFRRSLRNLVQNRIQFFTLAFMVLLASLMAGSVGVVLLDTFGGSSRLPDMARTGAATLWISTVFVVTQRVASMRPNIDAENMVLTTVSVRTAVTGLYIAEWLRILSFFALPTIVGAAVFVHVLGDLFAVVSIPVTVIAFTLTAVVVGSVLGYFIARLIATKKFFAKYRLWLRILVVAVVVGVFAIPEYTGFSFLDLELMGYLPFGWFADLALAGSTLSGSMVLALAVLAGSVAAVVLGIAVLERQAGILWYSDPISFGDDTPVEDQGGDGIRSPEESNPLEEAVRPLKMLGSRSKPSKRTAEWAVLRTRRDPRRLSYLFIPLIVFGNFLLQPSNSHVSPSGVLVPVAVVGLPWLAGSLFGLNPYGDEGSTLPVTALAVSGVKYVRGLVLPSLNVGIPLVLVGTFVTAIVSDLSIVQDFLLFCVGILLVAVSATVAPAVGMVFPRYDSMSLGRSTEVLPPRMLAVGIHALALGVPGLLLAALVAKPGLGVFAVAGILGYIPSFFLNLVSRYVGFGSGIAGWFQEIGGFIESLDTVVVQLGFGVPLYLGGIAIGYLGYRYAVRNFDDVRMS
ncbi:MAG: hypothetical protein ABEK59_04565 [Halobacteria archaeon]